MSWFNAENNGSVWVVGDSLITRGSGDYTTLIDSGAKIFAVPLICKAPDESNFFGRTVLDTKIGLAYAGSSLVGLNIYAVLSTIFPNLVAIEGSRPPSIEDLGSYAKMISKSYIQSLAQITPDSAPCELSIMGFCSSTGLYKICHIYPDFSSGSFDMSMTTYSNEDSKDDFVLLLGDRKSEIESLIKSKRDSITEKDITWYRAPQHVLNQLVSNNTYGSIGGYLQQGLCFGRDFTITSRLISNNGTFLSHLGFDVTGDASRVGSCIVGMPGMI
ncbi:hypothetical protein [Kistimonas scapharcae]|uniref:hypothetical protein n=1 Tax=Kistimonas scapharcae TaxID=1036133 RepID=UPI0031E60B33